MKTLNGAMKIFKLCWENMCKTMVWHVDYGGEISKFYFAYNFICSPQGYIISADKIGDQSYNELQR